MFDEFKDLVPEPPIPTEKTLVFIKPDAVKRGLVGKIITRFEDKGFEILELKKMTVSSELAAKHYEEHFGKPFFPYLKQFIMSGPIVVMVLEGIDAVSAVRKMIGITNSAKAESGTIRGDFSLSGRFNIMHASDSPESAAREIANFFH